MPITPFATLSSKRLRWLFAALLACVPCLVWAVSGGTLSGTIKDQSGGVIPDAKLKIVNDALKTEFNATSDATGAYIFPNLAVGQYTLTIDAQGKSFPHDGMVVHQQYGVFLFLDPASRFILVRWHGFWRLSVP